MSKPKVASAEAQSILGLKHKILLCGDRAAPLVFLVHGRAGSFDVMWTFRRALPESVNMIAPEAPLPDPIGGRSWWQIGEGESKVEIKESACQAAGLLQQFTEKSIISYDLAPSAVLGLGFSQGAGLLSILAQQNAATFKALALLAGFVVRVVDQRPTGDLPSIFVGHGEDDDVVPLAQAQSGADFLRDLGYQVAFHTDKVKHKVGSTVMRELQKWVRDVTH